MNSYSSFDVKFITLDIGNICNGLLLGNATIARWLSCCKKASRKSWSTDFSLGGDKPYEHNQRPKSVVPFVLAFLYFGG